MAVLSYGYYIGDISVILIAKKDIKSLNNRYLGKKSSTDIIAFDYSVGKHISGDLYICYQQVKENAKIYGVTTKNELYRVIIHGFLHLMGFTDNTAAGFKEMKKEEDNMLALYAKYFGKI